MLFITATPVRHFILGQSSGDNQFVTEKLYGVARTAVCGWILARPDLAWKKAPA